MTDYSKTYRQAQTSVLEAMRQFKAVQDEVVSRFNGVGSQLAPELPSAREIVESNYQFTNEWLQLQREMTLSWLDAIGGAERPRNKS